MCPLSAIQEHWMLSDVFRRPDLKYPFTKKVSLFPRTGFFGLFKGIVKKSYASAWQKESYKIQYRYLIWFFLKGGSLLNEGMAVFLNIDPEKPRESEELIRRIDRLLLKHGIRYSGIRNLYSPIDQRKGIMGSTTPAMYWGRHCGWKTDSRISLFFTRPMCVHWNRSGWTTC